MNILLQVESRVSYVSGLAEITILALQKLKDVVSYARIQPAVNQVDITPLIISQFWCYVEFESFCSLYCYLHTKADKQGSAKPMM